MASASPQTPTATDMTPRDAKRLRVAFDGTPADFKSKGAGQMDQAFHALTNEN